MLNNLAILSSFLGFPPCCCCTRTVFHPPLAPFHFVSFHFHKLCQLPNPFKPRPPFCCPLSEPPPVSALSQTAVFFLSLLTVGWHSRQNNQVGSLHEEVLVKRHLFAQCLGNNTVYRVAAGMGSHRCSYSICEVGFVSKCIVFLPHALF